jgi:hypothetical protein
MKNKWKMNRKKTSIPKHDLLYLKTNAEMPGHETVKKV